MLHGDAVDKAGGSQGHIGHVEHAVVTAAHTLEQVCHFRAENPVGLVHGKAVMSRGNWSVGGEHTPVAHCLRIPFLNGPAHNAVQL